MNILLDARDMGTFGKTVELNCLGSQKVCSFDCVYCSLGTTEVMMSRFKADVQFPTVDIILDQLAKTLAAKVQSNEKIDTLLLSGNGEPTLYPKFFELVRGIIGKRKEIMPDLKIAALTSGDTLDDRNVTDALNRLDESIVKLDAGTNRSFKKTNRPRSRATLDRIILGARNIENLSVQTMVSSELLLQPNLDEWLEVIAMLNPKKVYLSIAKRPTADPQVSLPTEEDMNLVAHWLERKLKFKAQVGFDFVA